MRVYHTRGFVTRYRQPGKIFKKVRPMLQNKALPKGVRLRPKSCQQKQILNARSRREFLEMPRATPWHPTIPVFKQFGRLPRAQLSKIKQDNLANTVSLFRFKPYTSAYSQDQLRKSSSRGLIKNRNGPSNVGQRNMLRQRQRQSPSQKFKSGSNGRLRQVKSARVVRFRQVQSEANLRPLDK